GRNGEDGVMQGLLELSGVPYIGCKTRSAAVTMDKAVTKMILEKYGIKQTEWMLFYKKEYLGDPEAALR
ncbi:MAG TPA: D-alanine--D-alanine ligase A, partial [Clostridiales bacterium]|nr:D-alanine--D-alanine ligase A [Clostridiales bacterium]